jgi:hypothetical protein
MTKAARTGPGGVALSTGATLLRFVAQTPLDALPKTIAMPGHPSVPLLPGLVALGEARGRAGLNLLAAFVLGVEQVEDLTELTGRARPDAASHP